MKSRTVCCSHEFIVPNAPEPWLVPVSKGGASLKASRYCLQCWQLYGAIFQSRGFEQITEEDPCRYGFVNLIHAVIKKRGHCRDQDHFEGLETDLRIKLLEARDRLAAVANDSPATLSSYVRTVLEHKIEDIQTTQQFQAESAWEPLEGDDPETAAFVSNETPLDAVLRAEREDEQGKSLSNIERLPPEEQEVLQMRFLQEVPSPRADVLEKLRSGGFDGSAWDVRTLERRALSRLRPVLGGQK